MRRTTILTVITLATTFLLHYATISFGQDRKRIDTFIKKNVITDIKILYSNDSVPHTLNLIFQGVLISNKNSQIIIPSDLFSEYFSSDELLISKSGRVILSNPTAVKNDTAIIFIKLKGNQNTSSTLKIPLNYKGTLLLDYSGQNGKRGENGEEGKNGKITGSTSSDPENGKNGKHGFAGEKGANLQIALTQNNSNTGQGPSLCNLIIHNISSSITDTFKIDILNSKAIIMSNGGSGGDGGLGGNGGHGANGDRNAMYTSYGQFGALGGRGGNGGFGGDGGQISIFIDSHLMDFINNIHVLNQGGPGGKGGKEGTMGTRGVNYSRGQEFPDVRTIRNMNKDMPNLNGLDGVPGNDGPETQIELVDSLK